VNAHRRCKGELYDLVGILHGHGITSPTDLAQALGISRHWARRVLLDLGLAHPHRTLAQQLARLPHDVRVRVVSFHMETKGQASR
jgi:hypothetical protein